MRCTLVLAAALLAVPTLRAADKEKGDAKVPAILSYKMKALDGKETNLTDFQGKVVVFVNVASECGYTDQYKGLQELYAKYKDQGLVIVGVPANEFGKQEPGTDAEIAKFCKTNYGVTFPMMSKVVVKGKGICPLYEHLTSKEKDPKFGGDVKWNFTKFLIARSGDIVGRFEPAVEPTAEEMVKAIEAELKKK
jgi:glutathione peroxidase